MTRADEPDQARSRPPLKVGLVVASLRGPAWIADVAKAIADSGDAVVVDVLVTESGAAPLTAMFGRALLRLYGWFDGHIFGRSGDPTRILDLRRTIAGISTPGLSVSVADNPDLVIRFDGGGDRLERWTDPSLGAWALVHGVGLPSAARPERFGIEPGGPEMLLGRTITISQLVTAMGDERQVLGQVVSGVDPLSLRRGARGHLRKLPSLVARTVWALRSEGALPDPIGESAADMDASDRATLDSIAISKGLTRLLVGYMFRLIMRRAAREKWFVGIAREQEPRGGDRRGFQLLDAPEGREWADPFPLRTPDADLLFVEEYVWATRRGRLAVVELDDSSRGWRSVETILDLPTHLSYPFVFEWSGEWYLLPEQAATGGLQLYVAEAFPRSWRWHSTALELPAADATIAEIDGHWWMFAAIAVVGGLAADELHLFHAETPLGPWTAHARNPVVSDIRSARPAGRVFQRGHAWHRVAQDGSISYGHSITITRIDRIDLHDYRETIVDVIRPDWAPGITATHTLNNDGDLTALDARRR